VKWVNLQPRDFPYITFRIVKSNFTLCNIVEIPYVVFWHKSRSSCIALLGLGAAQ
jgi:hypothetical protein